MEANNLTRAPEGATHRYEHGGLISWYRETDDNLFVWRDGSWHGAVHKTTLGLVKSCMLGRLTLLAMEQADPVEVTAPAWFTQLPAADEQAQPVEDNLTWLVRSTKGEWFGNSTHIARDGTDDYLWATAPRLPAEYHWFNKAQYLAVRSALQNKPSWADAPEWALSVTQRSNGEWFWLGSTDQFMGPSASSGCCGEVLGDWRDTLEQRPQAEADITDPFDPEFRPVTVSNETVQMDKPVVVAGTGMSIGEWAAKYSGKAPSAQIREAVLNEALRILRDHPDHFSAGELADLNELTGSELTKRDERICGGQKYLDATWHERGALPPVGVECEFIRSGDVEWHQNLQTGCKVTVLCHYSPNEGAMVAVFSFDASDGYRCGMSVEQAVANRFRPIRTCHQVLVDLALSNRSDAGLDERDLADAILAAGFKRDGGAA